MSVFKNLAEVISEKQFFKIEEVEDIIQTYFNIYLSDIRAGELESDAFQRERRRLMSEKSQLLLNRALIERQLLEAKLKIAEGRGREVDKNWFCRASLAFRFTKIGLSDLQDRLGTLSSIERKRNAELANTRERAFIEKLRDAIDKRHGIEHTRELFNIAHANVEFEASTTYTNIDDNILSELLQKPTV